MSKQKDREKKAIYKEILEDAPADLQSLAAPAPKSRPSRGNRLVTGIIVLLVALLVVFCVILFRVQFLGASAGALFGAAPDNQPANTPQAALTPEAQAQVQTGGTLFLGDSNTVRLHHLGLVPESQVLALSSIGVGAVTSNAFVQLQEDASPLTIEEAVAILQPRRILITFGTNDIGNLTVTAFIQRYQQALDALQAVSPATDIIVGAIPLVCEYNSYSKLSCATIAEYNAALQQMCADRNLIFLDTTTVLAGEDGHLPPHYADGDGVHLTDTALVAILNYYYDSI